MTNILVETLLKGYQRAPEDIDLILSLAKAYESNGDQRKALEFYQKAVVLDGELLSAIDEIIRLAVLLEQPSVVTAYKALKQAFISNKGEVEREEIKDEIEPVRVRGQKLTLVSNYGEKISNDIVEVEDSSIYLSDVGGMSEVKKRINLTFLAPLSNPDFVKKYGKKISSGLILYGPPGCGKTFIARALAGELGAKFISVSLSDILDMYIGESERKLHEIFESARRNAPAVLFFDELDAIGQKRSHLKNSGMRTLVNQLLNEMDSVEGNNEGVFTLAATNLPWDIDSALKRPGRFDRVIAVFPPDLEARIHIIERNLSDVPKDNIDVNTLAQRTELFSGADLAHLCQSAIDVVFEEALETGDARPLNMDDFVLPLKEVKPSTRSWFDSARNYAIFANQSGSYDDLLAYMRDMKL